MRVISGTVLKRVGRLPRQPDDNDNIIDWESRLEEWLRLCDETGKVADKRIVCGFISHRWLRAHQPCGQCGVAHKAGKMCPNSRTAHADDAQHSKAKVLTKFLATSDEMIEWYFWLDFSGIHQSCPKRQLAGMILLPGYIACVEGCLLLLTPGYECRSWCRLERLLAYRFCPAYSFYVLTLDFPNPPNLDQLLPARLLTGSIDIDGIHLDITDPCGLGAKITNEIDMAAIGKLQEAALSLPIARWPDIKDTRHQKAAEFAFGHSSQVLFSPNGVLKTTNTQSGEHQGEPTSLAVDTNQSRRRSWIVPEPQMPNPRRGDE